MLVEPFSIIFIGQYYGQSYLFIHSKYQHLLRSLGNFSDEVSRYFFLIAIMRMKIIYSIVALLAKLLGVVLWIVTFIDFYSSAPVGLRYFLCLFPNVGLLFCVQVLQQYERRSG